MAVSSNKGPQLQLALEGKARNDEVAGGVIVWNPTNVLRGYLEITCISIIDIVEATIFFEGNSRNWVPGVVARNGILHTYTAERKFLSQTMDMSPSMVEPSNIVVDNFRLTAPFHFVISTVIINPSPGSPLHCLRLPPSIELGKVYVSDLGKRFAQPSVSYELRAVVQFVENGQNEVKSAETSIPIVIMPHNEEMPPTDTTDFPAEFKLQESKKIQGSLLGCGLGTMTVSMQEPRAVIYDSSSTGGTTEAFLDLAVDSTAIGVYQSLQAMSFKVFSLIRVKTFYSVQAFPRTPSQSLLTGYSGTRLRDDMIKLETLNILSVSWAYNFDVGEHDMTLNPTKTNQLQQGKWSAKISYPISVDLRLLPTFCSSIVARLYSLILRLKVSGIRKESFDLEVPLQVVHTSPAIASSVVAQDLEATIEPMREDLPLLELRRPSLASWFSDESLESEEPPPRYH